MKLQSFAALFAGITLLAMLSACNDPTFLGSDLVEQDAIEVEFTDDIVLEARTIRLDSVRTYSPTNSEQISTYLCGNMQDPYFGTTRAQIFTQVGIQFSRPDFVRAALDSIFLVLPYDTAALYNYSDEEVYAFEVLRMTEQLNSGQRYFSDERFPTDMMPLGQIETQLRPFSADTVIRYSSAGTPTVLNFPHLRIPLDAAFGEELLNLDEELYENDSTFISHLPGISVRATNQTNGITGFNLRSGNAGLVLFYSRSDTVRQFIYPFKTSNVRMVNFEHDYTDAPVEPFIGSAELGDSLIFAQAASGLDMEITFPDLSKFEGVVVNKAVLRFTVADLSTDGADDYPPIEQFLAIHENSNGNFITVPEIAQAVITNTDFRQNFGGTVARTKDGKSWQYEINISNHFQDVIDGFAPDQIRIQAFPNQERASRVGMYGPGAADDKKLRMELTFTRL